MKQSLRIIPFLLGLFLFIEGFLSPASARTENTNKEVLVLNSINFNLPWAKKTFIGVFMMLFRNKEFL